MEEHLQSVEFAILDRVAAEINFCQQRQVLNECELCYLADVIQLHSEEAKTLCVLKTLQLLDLVLRNIESLKYWQSLKTGYSAKAILLKVKFLNVKPIQVFNCVD